MPEEDVVAEVVCVVPGDMRPARKDLDRRAAVWLTTFWEDGEMVRRSRRDADICLGCLHEYMWGAVVKLLVLFRVSCAGL